LTTSNDDVLFALAFAPFALDVLLTDTGSFFISFVNLDRQRISMPFNNSQKCV